jgi:hypothetical protein
MPHARDFQWLAVRCCCNPKKILGFLPVQERSILSGIARVQQTYDPDIMLAMHQSFVSDAMLKVHGVKIRQYGMEHAVYSDDRPVEFWRKIHNFVEAK